MNSQVLTTGNFSVEFTYTASGGFPNNAADGVAFVLQQATGSSKGGSGASALGGTGGSLGYTGISGPSLAVALNLYSNSTGGAGTSFTLNGGTTTPYQPVSPVNLDNNDPKNILISYIAANQILMERFSIRSPPPRTP